MPSDCTTPTKLREMNRYPWSRPQFVAGPAFALYPQTHNMVVIIFPSKWCLCVAKGMPYEQPTVVSPGPLKKHTFFFKGPLEKNNLDVSLGDHYVKKHPFGKAFECPSAPLQVHVCQRELVQIVTRGLGANLATKSRGVCNEEARGKCSMNGT